MLYHDGPLVLLQTKFGVPPVRDNLVPRWRLLERLDAAISGRLTLISAPPGFGKTTLVSMWLRQRKPDPLGHGLGLSPVRPQSFLAAWLTLDEGDNDLIRFVTYLIAALQRLHPESTLARELLPLLHSAQPPPLTSILSLIVNQLNEQPYEAQGRYLLVLDDYHVITATPVHETVRFLLEHMPVHLHVLLSTRMDPPLLLAQLRARGQLAELRAADLRFTAEEATTFLNHVMDLRLLADELAALDARTEGWIVGLQLAALSIQQQPDTRAFMEEFAGSHRYILDYLVEQVLERQAPDVQRFLVQTAILDRLGGALCDDVLARHDSQTMLEQLERTNTFLVPLDEHRQWYRYHHLFADILRHRLQQHQPQVVPALQRRASQWFEQHGLLDEAITHAFSTNDLAYTVELLERNIESLLNGGRFQSLGQWIDLFPHHTLATRPRLGNARTHAFILAHQLDEAARTLDEVERFVTSNESETAYHQHIIGEVTTIRANLALYRGDVPGATALALKALNLLPTDNFRLRGQVMYCIGVGHNWRGELADSLQAHIEAFRLSSTAGDIYNAVAEKYNEAGIRMSIGQVRRAAELFQETLRYAAVHDSSHMPTLGVPNALLSELFYQWNDLDQALRFANEAIRYGEFGGNPRVIALGYARLAYTLQALRRSDEALNVLRRTTALLAIYELPHWHVGLVSAAVVQVWLQVGMLSEAAEWAQAHVSDEPDTLEWTLLPRYNALARVLITRRELPAALILLEKVLKATDVQGERWMQIEALVLQALALQAQGNRPQAYRVLDTLLVLCEPMGIVRRFVDEGISMHRLLENYRANHGFDQSSSLASYLDQLLAAFVDEGESLTEGVNGRPAQPSPLPLVESLTERELEVLRLVAEGLSDRQIAQRLVLALGTVKKHLNNIYGKLGAHSRVQALSRAREFELL